jgi:hypothetical protein
VSTAGSSPAAGRYPSAGLQQDWACKVLPRRTRRVQKGSVRALRAGVDRLLWQTCSTPCGLLAAACRLLTPTLQQR